MSPTGATGPGGAGPSIRVADLAVVRGGDQVLCGIDFEMASGSVTGLLGPSGCGKTTLIRAIMGVQRRVTGTVEVLGRAAGDPALRSEVAYVTQAPSVYADLTVGENLEYFARCLGVGSDAVGRVLDVVNLRERRDQVTSTLSGGQRSRVSLGSALLGDPLVLVLDEPTVGLDPVLRADLWATFRTLADAGVTLLVTSHVMDEADRCDRILLMREGRLLADESPESLRTETGCDKLDDAFLALVESDES